MSRRTRRHTAPLVIAAASAAGALLLCAPPASAHVRVIGDVIPGQPATLNFRVPSELKEATTVRLTVDVPATLTVTGVPSIDGWTAQRTREPGGKGTRLVWTAKPGHEIKPGASRTFPVRVGAIPDQRSVEFDTDQTYSNGTIASWNQEQTGAEEPEFPVPELVIDPAAPANSSDTDAPSSSAPATPNDEPRQDRPAPTVAAAAPSGSADEPDHDSDDDSGTPWAWLGGGTVAAAAVAGGGGFLIRRSRR